VIINAGLIRMLSLTHLTLGRDFNQPTPLGWPPNLVYITIHSDSKLLLDIKDLPHHIKYIYKGRDTIELDNYR
jgi:hypothetical protein